MTQHPVDERPVAVTVGETIHMHMWRQKISQAQLAEWMGVGQSVISKKLRGRIRLDVDELCTIARLLGVEPGDLLPRLDSNQQPSGYPHPQVSAPSSEPLVSARWAEVVDLAAWRCERVAS